MVQINVSQQLKSPTGTIRNYQVSEVAAICGASSLVRGELELIRTDRSILIRGTLHTDIEITCSRCLGVFCCPLTLSIAEEYFPVMDIVTGAALSLPDEPGSFLIDEHNILDLAETIRQYALMAIPMKPLCQPDCAGICPDCGSNLNQTPCSCPPELVDLRLTKLFSLVTANHDIQGK